MIDAKPDPTYDSSFDRAALRSQTEHETASSIADWLAATGMPGAADAVREGRYRPMEPHESPDLRTSHDKIGARLDATTKYASGFKSALSLFERATMSGVEPLPPTPSLIAGSSWTCHACGASDCATVRTCSGECIRTSATSFVEVSHVSHKPSPETTHVHVTCSRCGFQHVVNNANTEHIARAW